MLHIQNMVMFKLNFLFSVFISQWITSLLYTRADCNPASQFIVTKCDFFLYIGPCFNDLFFDCLVTTRVNLILFET